MGLLDGLLGGVTGAALATVLNKLIESHGGLQGLTEQFQREGLGPTIQSWIGTGENKAISPQQMQQVLGNDTMQQLSAKLGISPEALAAKLADYMPKAVDKMTPDGTIPRG